VDKEVQNDMQEQHELGDAKNRNEQEHNFFFIENA